jgi:hypothetical protein
MPTYLLTQDVLNVAVSCFANYDTPANPVTINLLTWLHSPKHRAKIEALRLEPDKSKRDTLKATLPAITPSAVFTYRQESSMVAGSHTRLIQFDIDAKDNPRIRNYADLKNQLCKLPFIAFCALSASGKGYWGLVPIAHQERHSQHFDALKRVFAHYGIHIDTKPRNVASLRGYSYDAAPYMPQRVTVFELCDEPKKPKPRPFDLSTDADTDRQRVEACIQEILQQRTYIGDSYSEWYAIGCGLANTFGENGRYYFHLISQHYSGYQPTSTDKQFTACLKAKSKATLGTFFHLCQQQGIEWKELLPFFQQEKRELTSEQPPAPIYVKTIAEQLARPGSILKPDENQLERFKVELCNSYPAEWNSN